MAYLTCPDCRMPSPVEDSAISYRCFAFTCGQCDAKVDIPRRRLNSTSVKARVVKGYGHTYPRF
jgi:hypothetical protein